MTNHVSESHLRGTRIAITVARSGFRSTLCPFFGKCDGVLVFDSDTGAAEFHVNPARTAAAICDLIIAARPTRLICGFIGETEKRKLRTAGIDVRLGSCVRAVEELVASFHELAAA